MLFRSARCPLRHWRRPCGPCLRTCHSPSPRNLIPVRSINRFRGPRHGDRGSARRASSAVGRGSNGRARASQPGHFQQAGHPTGRLPQGQIEQNLDRQADLDRRVGEPCGPTRATIMRREPGHRKRPTRSATSRACGAMRYRWTSSSCGSGRVRACSCSLSNRMDSQCESPMVRIVQQRLSNLKKPKASWQFSLGVPFAVERDDQSWSA